MVFEAKMMALGKKTWLGKKIYKKMNRIQQNQRKKIASDSRFDFFD